MLRILDWRLGALWWQLHLRLWCLPFSWLLCLQLWLPHWHNSRALCMPRRCRFHQRRRYRALQWLLSSLPSHLRKLLLHFLAF